MAEGESLKRDTDRITKLLGDQIDRADRYKSELTKLQAQTSQSQKKHEKRDFS